MEVKVENQTLIIKEEEKLFTMKMTPTEMAIAKEDAKKFHCRTLAGYIRMLIMMQHAKSVGTILGE